MVFRFKNLDIFFKQGLLYAILTLMVLGLYFVLVYAAEWVGGEHFQEIHLAGIIGASIIFLSIRSFLQHRIDRLFHREQYNSTKVIESFENTVTGIYEEGRLHDVIFDFLNSIFHFTSFTCMKRLKDGSFRSSHHIGHSEDIQTITVIPPEELSAKIARGEPFAFRELRQGIPGLEQHDAELILPRVFNGIIGGVFILGRKKSGKSYSREDINLLGILTRRAAAFFHTAELYNNELNRQLALERERSRIAKDLHDDIGASLTRVTMFSEAAAQELHRSNTAASKKKIERYLEEIAEHSRLIVEELSDVVWSLNPKNDTLDDIGLRMKNYLGRLHLAQNIDYEVDVSAELALIPLPLEFKKNLYLIFKEAINNTLKHARADLINVKIGRDNGCLRMMIQDNGSGFDQSKGTDGNGLKNIRHRVSEMGGAAVIQSDLGRGTTVTVNVIIP